MGRVGHRRHCERSEEIQRNVGGAATHGLLRRYAPRNDGVGAAGDSA